MARANWVKYGCRHWLDPGVILQINDQAELVFPNRILYIRKECYVNYNRSLMKWELCWSHSHGIREAQEWKERAQWWLQNSMKLTFASHLLKKKSKKLNKQNHSGQTGSPKWMSHNKWWNLFFLKVKSIFKEWRFGILHWIWFLF